MAHCFPEDYARCIDYSHTHAISLCQAETRIFGFNHQHCGQVIALKWKLNDTIIQAIKYHHTPELADAEYKQLVSSITLADIYANIFEIGSAANHQINEQDTMHSIAQSPISWKQLTLLHESIDESIKKASIFLQIS